jgi:DNA repair protein RecO (recombination protein O)
VPDRSRVYHSEAIVLRHSEFGEADRLLTVYTPELGKLRLLAKGVRKPRSRKAGHLELFTRTELLVARGRNLDIITQAQAIEPYRALRCDLWRMSNACYVVELVDAFGEEQAENAPLYLLLSNALGWICTADDLPLTLRFFELSLLALVGYRPQLYQCVHCATALEPEVNYFSAEDGGMLCPRCIEHRSGVRVLSLGALKVLRYLQTRPYAECAALKLQAVTRSEVEQVLQSYLVYLLERKLKSVEFMSLVRNCRGPNGA